MSSFTSVVRVGRLALATILLVAIIAGASSAVAGASAQRTYIVLYHSGASTAKATQTVQRAGGTLVANYSQIGVVVARTSDSGFAASVSSAAGVDSAAATTMLGAALKPSEADASDPLPESAPATDSDTLSGLQWDMRQIHTAEAHAITGGSRQILVGDLDTCLLYTSPSPRDS